jgi:protein arginine kinase activator
MQALEHLSARVRSHPSRCETCRTSLANFKASGRFGCPNCYEHFRTQVQDLLPRVHAGAYRHRGKTPGRR